MEKSFYNWDELVFEYRRKDYGAFPMRYNYPYYVSIAAGIVLFIFLCSTVGPKLFGKKENNESATTVTKMAYVDLKAAPQIEKNIPKPAVAKYVAPKVTKEEVKPEEMVPTQDQAAAAVDNKVVETPIETKKEEVVVVEEPPAPVAEEAKPEPKHEPVVIAPSFPGGTAALTKWLKSHINYPPMAQRMGIEGTVVVQFTVSGTGKISDVTVVKAVHTQLNNEAMRLVKAMPDWNAGSIDGVPTTQTYLQPITFKLE